MNNLTNPVENHLDKNLESENYSKKENLEFLDEAVRNKEILELLLNNLESDKSFVIKLLRKLEKEEQKDKKDKMYWNIIKELFPNKEIKDIPIQNNQDLFIFLKQEYQKKWKILTMSDSYTANWISKQNMEIWWDFWKETEIEFNDNDYKITNLV